MSACLWNDIDSKWLALFTAEMGSASAYPTLKLQTIVIGEQFDPDHVTMPFCMIRGLECVYESQEDGPHGDGEVHYDGVRYPYDILFAVTSDTLTGAKADIQELIRRTREMIREHVALDGISSSDGETVYNVEPRGIKVEVRGLGGNNQGKMLGLAVFEIDVFSEV